SRARIAGRNDRCPYAGAFRPAGGTAGGAGGARRSGRQCPPRGRRSLWSKRAANQRRAYLAGLCSQARLARQFPLDQGRPRSRAYIHAAAPPSARPPPPGGGPAAGPRRPPAAPAGNVLLAVAARYGQNAPPISAGLIWRVYAARPDSPGNFRLIKEDRAAAPTFTLPPG